MLVLSLDTSLSLFSVALVRDGQPLAVHAAEGKGSRNEKLLPAIDWLLSESGLEKREIDRIAVTRGPGSFTGVRVGLATVQGLAFAIQRPVSALSTHEAVLGSEQADDVIVISDAGRGESYVSGFRGDAEVVPPSLVTADELETLRSRFGRALVVEEILRRQNVALLCAERVMAIDLAGGLASRGDATPIYVRLAEAEVKLQRKRDV